MKRVLLATLLVARATVADDARYQDYPVGSRAMTLGGAFAAIADDPSGLTYNPAGICDTHRLNVNVSASLYGFERQSRGAIKFDANTFSLASLATLNVIPGEAGVIKGVGTLDERGAPLAFGFDVTVPSFHATGLDATTPATLHSRTVDRTFDVAAGAAFRAAPDLNLGLALHYVLRLYEQTEDSLLTQQQGSGDAKVGVYHATASFQNASLVPVLGAKLHLPQGWSAGLAVGLPGLPIHSAGKVNVQDVTFDPQAPSGSRSSVYLVDTQDVESETPVPALLRVGVAHIERGRWTVSGQLTGHLGTSYDRFRTSAEVQKRLRLQSHVERSPVLDANVGGEYLVNSDYSVALGFFTDQSGAAEIRTQADGSVAPGSSRITNVSLVGGTATFGMLGNHSITRVGVSVSAGNGDDAVANDPSGIFDATGFSRASVRQLQVYVFLASTFRY